MSLTPGSKLGIYEIVAPLGAGGMGEVYRARDTRLGRDVAIKALPPQFAQDPERLARFEREAKLLASVSHPHIAGIFGLEDIDKHRYLVLEFVEGETLAQRLDRGTPSIDESLQICRQIASALESAHENGIAHRDLKPGNVMITSGGDVKVLDFGLAKGGMGTGSSSDISLSHSPTMTHQHTGAGVILGTAAYMSPEQARGRAVDKRTDIWSFGCVLYECLCGRQAFEGETVSDLIARILEREPDWDALPSRTPSRIRELLKRCLEKDPKQRMRDIGDARIEIDNVIATKSSNPEARAAAAAANRSRARVRSVAGALALVAATAAATYFGVPRGEKPSTEVTRFEISEMPGTRMDVDGVLSGAISPDGRMVVYAAVDSAGNQSLWLRSLEALNARRLPGTNNGVQPFWSADGRSIGFFQRNTTLMKVAIAGGTPETVTSVKNPRGGTWNRDGVILYVPLSDGPIYRVSANGGDGVAITKLDSTESAHRYPIFLPDGKHFLYTALPPREGRYRIYMGSLDGKERKLVLDSAGSGASYSPPGYLLYDRDGVVIAHRFDAKSGRVLGEPVPLGDHPIGTGFSGGPEVFASANGTLSFTTNTPFATHLVWADLEGRTTSDIPVAAGKYINVELSPDEREAVIESSPRIGISDLWLADLERGVATRLSYEGGENTNTRWSPDGSRVAYTASSLGSYQKIVVVNVRGGAPESYLENEPVFKNIYGWTPDGRALVYGRQDPATRWDIWILPLDGDRKPRPFLETPYWEDSGRVSPDGRWMVYRSNESGQYDVYVQSFPDGGNKYKVTTHGGQAASWSSDGRRLLYSVSGENETIYTADVLAGPAFRLGPARLYARFPDTIFDLSFSRQDRLLLLVPARPLPPQTITIVQNWPALLSRK